MTNFTELIEPMIVRAFNASIKAKYILIKIDLLAVNKEMLTLERQIRLAKDKHNAFLKELGLPLLQWPEALETFGLNSPSKQKTPTPKGQANSKA